MKPVHLALVLLATTAAGTVVHAQATEPRPVNASVERATLVVMNASGKTLISGKQTVKDNGKTLVSLPRKTFARVSIEPGQHVLRPSSVKKPEVHIDAEANRTYFVVVAYKPERSWAFPLAGSPLVLQQVSEEEAKALLADMTEHVSRKR